MIDSHRAAYRSYDDLVRYRQSANGIHIYVLNTAECRMPNADGFTIIGKC